jgi:excisionase family DNA binding protein
LSTTDRLAYRPGEAADVLGVSRTTVYELMRDGSLGFVAIGRARRIPKVEIERWLTATQVGATATTSSRP